MFTQTRPKKFVNKVGLKERTGPWWQVRYARADPQESREIKEHERRKSIFGYQSCLPENHSSLRKPCSFPIIKNGANTSCQLNHPTSATKNHLQIELLIAAAGSVFLGTSLYLPALPEAPSSYLFSQPPASSPWSLPFNTSPDLLLSQSHITASPVDSCQVWAAEVEFYPECSSQKEIKQRCSGV